MAQPLKCLSIRQPWAWAVCVGAKDVENRSRSTTHRGTMAIHAGANEDQVNHLLEEDRGGRIDRNLFTFGAIIGVADLVNLLELNESLEHNPWASGPYCWLLENPRLLPRPIPHKGKLGLYTLPQPTAQGVRDQLTEVRPAPNNPALQACVEAIRPTALEMHLVRAENYHFSLEDDEGAIRSCTAILQCDPASVPAYRIRGLAQSALGQHQKGVADCEEAVRLSPEDARSYYACAIVYRNFGDGTKADWNLRKAREINPEVPDL